MNDPGKRPRAAEHGAQTDTRLVRDEDLDAVSGGKHTSDFVFVHKSDKASPVLS